MDEKNRTLLWAVLVLSLAAASLLIVWLVSAHSPDPRLTLSRYTQIEFARNLLLTYLILLAAYILSKPQGRRDRIWKALIQLGTLSTLYALIELPVLLGWVDYRSLLIPKMLGGKGPHNRIYEKEFYFHRPPRDHFKNSLPGDSMILAGMRSDRYYSANHEYDRYGFRNHLYPEKATLVLLGDSFVEGYKVTQSKIISSELGRLLNTTVYNLGQCDYGPENEQAVFQRLAIRLHPRIVLWFFYEQNDLYDFQKVKRNWSNILGKDRSFWERSFFMNAITILGGAFHPLRQHIIDRSARLQSSVDSQNQVMYFEPTPYPIEKRELLYFDRLKSLISETDSSCREIGCHLLFVYVPMKFRVYRQFLKMDPKSRLGGRPLNDFPQRFREWTTTAGIHFLDLTPALTQAAKEGKLVYFLDDAHWSPEGHRVVAEDIAGFIRNMPMETQ